MKKFVVATCLALTPWLACAQEDAIRKNLPTLLPKFPKIEEVRPTPMNGLYEVRVNESEIFYTDAKGEFLVQGHLIDLKSKRNLTEERTEKLQAIPFDKLPLKDAFTIVRGKGERKLAVFEDPRCGYCKRFERDLQKIDNVTIHMFLYPILGPESVGMSKTIWCAKDKKKSFLDWMIRDVPPVGAQNCDTSTLARNTEFGRKHKINGTPTLIFADGSRVPGAVPADQVEKMLAEAQ
ncbi:MAG: putative thiol:disulfide interchange protein DsbC precursor [Pseudomonadota bacterium]|jgi:thiol:disulfide interchange protein DsbC